MDFYQGFLLGMVFTGLTFAAAIGTKSIIKYWIKEQSEASK